MKVLSIVGNRPQFIKSAPLSLALRAAHIDEVVLHTGQHYDHELSRVFFDELELGEPRYSLELQTADPDAMLPPILEAILDARPDWILVDGIAALLFCPDERSRGTLQTEGVSGRIEVVGDVMADASLRFAPIARERSRILEAPEL